MLPVSALCCVKMRGVDSRVQTRNWDLIRCQICQHLGLGFPASRTVRNQCRYSSYPVNGILLRQPKQTKTGVIEQSMYISWVTWTCFHDLACKNSHVRSNDIKPIWKNGMRNFLWKCVRVISWTSPVFMLLSFIDKHPASEQSVPSCNCLS